MGIVGHGLGVGPVLMRRSMVPCHLVICCDVVSCVKWWGVMWCSAVWCGVGHVSVPLLSPTLFIGRRLHPELPEQVCGFVRVCAARQRCHAIPVSGSAYAQAAPHHAAHYYWCGASASCTGVFVENRPKINTCKTKGGKRFLRNMAAFRKGRQRSRNFRGPLVRKMPMRS